MTERERNKNLVNAINETGLAWAYLFNDLAPGVKPFDFLILYQGRFFGFEAKIGNRKLRPMQEFLLLRLQKWGGIGCVLRYFNDHSEISTIDGRFSASIRELDAKGFLNLLRTV